MTFNMKLSLEFNDTRLLRIFCLSLLMMLSGADLSAQVLGGDAAKEKKFYAISDVVLPDTVILEVGGMAFMDDGKLAVCTRRGEIWVITDPSGKPRFTKFAYGLHEPLGLAWHKGSVYVNQRSELTKMTDTDKDGKADLFETVATWPLSGNYHEYSYGPLVMPDGSMVVTLNLSWVGRGESLAKWRGWMMKVTPEGKVIPYAAGMRSPAGFGLNTEGDIFFAENQGDWISSGKITHVEEGDFAGHPASLRWAGLPGSPVKDLRRDQFPDSAGTLHEFARNKPNFKEPAVVFPHTLMGISTSDIVTIPSDAFGPFKGQLLVGDQGHSKVIRASLEKVKGQYQGACYPFLEGFSSGVLRLVWASDNTLFVGMTSRGWAATGQALYGLQRVRWTGAMPFEMKTVSAKSNGFEITFTKPVNRKLAEDLSNYSITGFTYAYHKKYGSPVIDQKNCPVRKVEVSADGLTVRLYVEGLREGYVHMVELKDLKTAGGEGLLHRIAYYTLNALPDGAPGEHDPIAATDHSGHSSPGKDIKGGCGEAPSKNVTDMPASWGKADVEITIGTKPGLKFDKEVFEVQEGAKVKLVFNNSDDMLHNLLITKPGKGEEVGEKALHLGLKGAELGYIPDAEGLLWTTCLLQPGSSQAIYFVAPKAGDYPYICSYPGHYLAMKGIMRVRKK
jgi:uncharacterized cupredoxin-like copper-binding protein/glucose/arabinose dehydrogenase